MARILIVDDDPIVSLTLSRMLGWAGHEVTLASSGASGLDAVETARPDAVLLDMRMPGMSGLEFLRILRGAPAHRDLPVGIVTGDYFMDEQVLAELSSLGAEVRYKPVWVDDLARLMAILLREHTADSGGHA